MTGTSREETPPRASARLGRMLSGRRERADTFFVGLIEEEDSIGRSGRAREEKSCVRSSW